MLKSLEAAKRAQDTADGKRRMFVQDQPVPPYDKGDQWSQATFGDKYKNDLLVCVKSRGKDEEFDIDDWASAQEYTTKKFEAQLKIGDKTIDAFVRDLRTDMESVGLHLDGENSTLTLVANKTRIQAADGTESAVFNADGTIDARRIIAQGTVDRIEYGIIDGRANLIIKDKEGNTMLRLNRNGMRASCLSRMRVMVCIFWLRSASHSMCAIQDLKVAHSETISEWRLMSPILTLRIWSYQLWRDKAR